MASETKETAVEMPIRDADLRHVATDRETYPGDDLWGLLVELQRRRDGDHRDAIAREA